MCVCDIGSDSLKMAGTKTIRMVSKPLHEIGSRLMQMLIQRRAVKIMVFWENTVMELVEICQLQDDLMNMFGCLGGHVLSMPLLVAKLPKVMELLQMVFITERTPAWLQ